MSKNNIKLFLVFSCIFIVLSGLTSISAIDPDNSTESDELYTSTSNVISTYDDIQTDMELYKKDENSDQNKVTKTNGESNRYIHVSSGGSSSSDGTDPENPTTLTNAFNNLENNDIIVLQANQTYNIVENISSKYSNTNTRNFAITSEDKDSAIINFFSTSTLELAGNQKIRLENVSFTRQYESEYPIIINNATLLEIVNCSFYNIKTASNHASIYNIKNLVITDCDFYDNTAKHETGVIYTENGTLSLANNVFINNSADNAAVVSSSKSAIDSVNNTFTNNYASFGGVFSLRDNSTLKIEKSSFINNSAKYYGGVVYSYYSNISVNDSVFKNNSADYGGVTYCVNNKNTRITNSLLENNMADSAAGDAYSCRDNLTLNNCVLINNNQLNSIYCYNSTYNLDKNWWGKNNPDFSVVTNGLLPNNWRVMRIDVNDTNSPFAINVSLNRLTDDSIINSDLITRTVLFSTSSGELSFESSDISSNVINLFEGDLDDLLVRIDNEELRVYDKINPYIEILNTAAYIDDSAPIIVKCNPDITDNILIYIDEEYFTSIVPVNGYGIFTTTFNSTWTTGTHTLTAGLTENNRYADTLVSASLLLKNMSEPIVNYVKYNVEANISNASIGQRLRLNDSQLVQTSVKNQGSSGSCWAFSSLATLESAYLKAYGIEYDFSENNMKNVLKKYSTLGDVSSNPNEGNGELEPIALLVGWYGPVEESEDPYYDRSITSPLLNSSVKVQDVYFIYRNSFVGKDNNALKDAILKYGALASSIYSSYSTFYSKSVYTTATAYADHAITIVGWDNFYATSNFYGSNRPQNGGAYIIKDSWGESIGEGGYQYVSYYDTSLAGVNIASNMTGFSYAFPVQTYENYTDIYQHDTISTNIKMLSPSAWIRNVYTARSNESIAAVGTFIYENCDYEVYIYVNDKLAYVQEGNFTQAGYRTIKLDKYVSVNEGDKFRVDLKLTAHNGDYTPVTIQDTRKYKSMSKENQSFISSDGVNWRDLFYDYDYAGSAACLKVYTRNVPRLLSSLTQDGNSYIINSQISNLNSNAKLSYTLDGKNYTDNDGNIIYINVDSNKTYNITIHPKNISHSTYNLTINLDVDNYTYSEVFSMTTPLNLKITTNNYTYYVDDPQIITAQITTADDYNNPVDEGKVLLIKDSAVIDECNVTNGSVEFVLDEESGNYTYILSYISTAQNTCDNVTTNISIKKHDTIIEISGIENIQLNKNMTITGTIHSDDDKLMTNTPLEVEIGEDTYNITSDENGEFVVIHQVTSGGQLSIKIRFNENKTHNTQTTEESVTIEKLNTSIMVEEIENAVMGDIILINGHLSDENGDELNDVTVFLTINQDNYEVPVFTGNFTLEYQVTTPNLNNLTATFNGNSTYNPTNSSTTFNVKSKTTFLFYNINSVDVGDVVKISAKLLSDGNPVVRQNVDVKVNNESYTTRTSTTGYFTIDYVAQNEGVNNVSFDYGGNTQYLPAHNDTTFIVRKNATFVFYKIKDADYGDTIKISAKLLSEGNPVKGQTITIKINNETKTAKTSTTGYFTINYQPTQTGTNNLTYIFNGNSEYKATSNITSFFIKERIIKHDTTFLFYHIKDVDYGDTIKISAKLLSEGNPVKGQTITIKINNETKTAKTSTTGYFTINYQPTQTGTNNLTYIFEGSTEYLPTINSTTFIVKENIIRQNVSFLFYKIQDVDYNESVKISGKLLCDGNPVKNKNVNLIINGQTHILKTSSTGYFVMEYIADTNGVNNVTFSFDGDDEYYATSNETTFNVKSETNFLFYHIKDVHVGSSVKISAKLLSGDVPAMKENVKIIVNDDVFSLTTSTTGYFVMNYVANAAGIYNLTFVFEGSDSYHPTQNFTTFKVLS